MWGHWFGNTDDETNVSLSTIQNCYNTGKYDYSTNEFSSGWLAGGVMCCFKNCYSLDYGDGFNGSYYRNVEFIDGSDFISKSTLCGYAEGLGASFKRDPRGGYPLLIWQ